MFSLNYCIKFDLDIKDQNIVFKNYLTANSCDLMQSFIQSF